MPNLVDTARRVVDLALRQGAKEARATSYKSREVVLEWRDGRTEKTTEATSYGVSFQLYVDGRYVSLATSDLRPEALATFVTESMRMARAIAVDPFRALPEKTLYAGRSTADLDLVDPGLVSLDADARKRIAKEIEDGARSGASSNAILSVTTSVSASQNESASVASNGFEGDRVGSEMGLSCEVSVKDPDGRRPEDSLFAFVRHRKDLPAPAMLGAQSTARAVAAIGAKKAESKIMTMVVENRVARRLALPLLSAMTARSLQQKQSFLDGKLGVRIGSKRFTLIDDPLVPRGLGSRHFDDEGIAAKKLTLVEDGELKAYYVDNYYGRKLNMAPTAGSASNVVLPGGKGDVESLLRNIKEGVLVTGFLGGNTNSTTGDYSLGVQGFRIRNGMRGEAIAETNISGNLLTLFANLTAVGDDPFLYSATRFPTLVFEAVQFAGT